MSSMLSTSNRCYFISQCIFDWFCLCRSRIFQMHFKISKMLHLVIRCGDVSTFLIFFSCWYLPSLYLNPSEYILWITSVISLPMKNLWHSLLLACDSIVHIVINFWFAFAWNNKRKIHVYLLLKLISYLLIWKWWNLMCAINNCVVSFYGKISVSKIGEELLFQLSKSSIILFFSFDIYGIFDLKSCNESR